MANTKLLEQEIGNIADARQRRITINFGLAYRTAPDVIDQIEARVRDLVEAHGGCRLVRCVVTALAPSSIDHELVYDDSTVEPDQLARHKAAIITALLRRFAADRIDFAYPSQTTFTAAPDGTLVMPYAGPSALPPASAVATSPSSGASGGAAPTS